jgi:hypothetical protein
LQQQQQQEEEEEEEGEEEEEEGDLATQRLKELLGEMARPFDALAACWMTVSGEGPFSSQQLCTMWQQGQQQGQPQLQLDALKVVHSERPWLQPPLLALLAQEPLYAEAWMYEDPGVGSSQMFGPVGVVKLALWAANMHLERSCTSVDQLRYLQARAQLQRQPACNLPIWLLLKCYQPELDRQEQGL